MRYDPMAYSEHAFVSAPMGDEAGGLAKEFASCAWARPSSNCKKRREFIGRHDCSIRYSCYMQVTITLQLILSDFVFASELFIDILEGR
jgi:hypothetical protein